MVDGVVVDVVVEEGVVVGEESVVVEGVVVDEEAVLEAFEGVK